MAPRSKGKLSILVVQQEKYDRERIVSLLKEEKVEVRSASDGRKGLDMIHEYLPQVLVTDMTLPHVNGLSLIEKGREAVPDLKVVVAFGPYNPRELVSAVEMNIKAFIRLPVDASKLREAVMECAREIALARRMAQADYSLRQLLDHFPNPAALVDGTEVVHMNQRLVSFLGYENFDRLAELDMGIEDFILQINGLAYDGLPGRWVEDVLNDPVDRDHVLHVENPRNPEGQATVFGVVYNAFPGTDLRLFTFQDISGLEDEKAFLEDEASTDPLTKAFNRRSFMRQLSLMAVSGDEFGLIMFDIDHFKSINDTYGHDVGDAVLREISQLVRNNIRAKDVLARWGGEEFMVLTPDSDLNRTVAMAERLRKAVAGFSFTGVPRPVTSSFGAVVFYDGETDEEMVKRADTALYEAKESGRNRVVTDS